MNTHLEVVQDSLTNTTLYNPVDVIASAVGLWTDADGQWRLVVEQLIG